MGQASETQPYIESDPSHNIKTGVLTRVPFSSGEHSIETGVYSLVGTSINSSQAWSLLLHPYK